MDAAVNYIEKNKLEFDLVAGGETAGIPYSAFISEKIKKPMIYIRKKPKGFGKNQQIEGSYKKKQVSILIEDLATDGGSKVIFVEAMRKAGLVVKDIFVIFYYDIFNFEESALSKLNVNILNILQHYFFFYLYILFNADTAWFVPNLQHGMPYHHVKRENLP